MIEVGFETMYLVGRRRSFCRTRSSSWSCRSSLPLLFAGFVGLLFAVPVIGGTAPEYRSEIVSLAELQADSRLLEEVRAFLKESITSFQRASDDKAKAEAIEDVKKDVAAASAHPSLVDTNRKGSRPMVDADSIGSTEWSVTSTKDFFTTHSCVGPGNCLVENLCHGRDGRFVYVKSPGAIFDRPEQIYYDTRYSGERHYRTTNATDPKTGATSQTFELTAPAGMGANGYKHYLASRIFEDLPGASITSRWYHPILHPKLRDVKIVNGAEEKPLPYPFWNGENREKTLQLASSSAGKDDRKTTEQTTKRDVDEKKQIVSVLMGRLWPTDAGHSMMDNMGPIYRALRHWGLLDLPHEEISAFTKNVVGVDSIAGGGPRAKLDDGGSASEQSSKENKSNFVIDLNVEDVNSNTNFLQSNALGCSAREVEIVQRALDLPNAPPTLEKDNCPIVEDKADLTKISSHMRAKISDDFEFVQVHVPGALLPDTQTRRKETTELIASTPPRKFRKFEGVFPARGTMRKLAVHLVLSPSFDAYSLRGRDSRYAACGDECESRLLQAFTDGDRSRILKLEKDLPRGKCFRKVLLGWNSMQFFNVFDWLTRNGNPAKHEISVGNAAEYLLGLRNYILAKHGLRDNPTFMAMLERQKVFRVGGRRVDRIRPSVALIVKRVSGGAGYNCCHWGDAERVRDHLLAAFDNQIDVQILSWQGISIYRQIWIMAETDISIAFAGADVMNFLFSPLHTGMISPYRLRNHKWERSYEIDRLWVNLPNRYLVQFGVNAVQRMGLAGHGGVAAVANNKTGAGAAQTGSTVTGNTDSTSSSFLPTSNQALVLAPWRQEKPRGIVRQKLVANLTWNTVNTDKADWPAVVFSELLIKEIELYVAECLEYMIQRGVTFYSFPSNVL
ncbi:unnamed protein product [Amoebophrya sp. A25]|nr:unnamed protein product [Amoebophrya sp. A25]|eukprot:GSA25T00007670001.1